MKPKIYNKILNWGLIQRLHPLSSSIISRLRNKNFFQLISEQVKIIFKIFSIPTFVLDNMIFEGESFYSAFEKCFFFFFFIYFYWKRSQVENKQLNRKLEKK